MLYEITSSEGKKSYLFGTIHINDKEVVTLPLEVKNAFDNAPTIVFETNLPNTDELLNTLNRIFNQWQQENSMPYSGATNTPIFSKTVEDLIPMLHKFSHPLDEQLKTEATRNGKKLGFLETYESQLKILMGYRFNYSQQMTYVDWRNHQPRTNALDGIEELKKNYLKGTVPAIQYAENTPEIVSLYNDSLIPERDSSMAESMKPFINKGNSFVAVGYMHLPGITQKLALEGYTINPVSLSQRVYPVSQPKEDEQKVAAFRKIYSALYAGQSSLLYKQDASPTEDTVLALQQIQEYAELKPASRYAEAWRLAKEHYQHVSEDNFELFSAVHKYSLEHSSTFFFFKRSSNFSKGYSQEQFQDAVKNASESSRTGQIRMSLSA